MGNNKSKVDPRIHADYNNPFVYLFIVMAIILSILFWVLHPVPPIEAEELPREVQPPIIITVPPAAQNLDAQQLQIQPAPGKFAL